MNKILELISLKQKDSFIENRLIKDVEIIKRFMLPLDLILSM